MTPAHAAHLGALHGLLLPVAADFVADPPASAADLDGEKLAEAAGVYLGAFVDGRLSYPEKLPEPLRDLLEEADDAVIEALIREAVGLALRLVLAGARERLPVALERVAEWRKAQRAAWKRRREERRAGRAEARREARDHGRP